MTPEAKARTSIDALLAAAGWHVCDMAQANIHAARGVAIREFPLNPGYGFADYPLRPCKTRSSTTCWPCSTLCVWARRASVAWRWSSYRR